MTRPTLTHCSNIELQFSHLGPTKLLFTVQPNAMLVARAEEVSYLIASFVLLSE